MGELCEVKGQRRGLHTQPLGNDTGGQPVRSAGHEQAEQFEAGFLSESAELSDRLFLMHARSVQFDLTSMIKIIALTIRFKGPFTKYRNVAEAPAIYTQAQTHGASAGWISRMMSGCDGMMG